MFIIRAQLNQDYDNQFGGFWRSHFIFRQIYAIVLYDSIPIHSHGSDFPLE